MQNLPNLLITLAVGALGGAVFSKLKIPGGALIGAMVAVVLFRSFQATGEVMPSWLKFSVQVMLGVMVGYMFKPQMVGHLSQLILPVIISSLALVVTGVLVTAIFHKLGIMDTPTAYMATSPGAMTAMVGLASDTKANLPVVLAFHFFRLFTVMATAPLLLKFLKWSLGR
ncbi:AbrB family transcriptional regulator [Dethiosulfatarculus sandiegensis]|nr:AbrB family transcriptional regulator [Dethiosulfatarculus sandiegensis]